MFNIGYYDSTSGCYGHYRGGFQPVSILHVPQDVSELVGVYATLSAYLEHNFGHRSNSTSDTCGPN